MSVKRKKAKGDGKKDGVAVLLEHMREKLGQELPKFDFFRHFIDLNLLIISNLTF